MSLLRLYTCILLLLPMACSASLLFINEFHYDNAGADENEFVELAGSAGLDLSSWAIILYNGSSGEAYNTINLSGILSDQSNGFGFHVINPTSIQNGSPDGIALVNTLTNQTSQFFSYEGSFTATNSIAKGLTSIDIGIEEGSSTPSNWSLQLTGTGNKASDFTWQAGLATAGELNFKNSRNGQQTFITQVGEPKSLILMLLAVIVLIFLASKRGQNIEQAKLT